METKLAIFLAFTSAVLLLNTAILWYAYKAFANVSTKVAKTLQEIQGSGNTKEWLKTMEAASFQAMTVSDTVKTQLHDFEPALIRAQSKWEFQLAQVDVQMEKGIAQVLDRTEKFNKAVEGPVTRLGSILSAIREAVQFLSGTNGEDTPSTPKR